MHFTLKLSPLGTQLKMLAKSAYLFVNVFGKIRKLPPVYLVFAVELYESKSIKHEGEYRLQGDKLR